MPHLTLSQTAKATLDEKLADSLVGPVPSGTPRRIHGTSRFVGKATAIIGMRRAGKTTYVHQLRREALDRGMDRSRVPFINFEDERLSELRGEHLGYLLDSYQRQVRSGSGLSGRSLPSDDGATTLWCFDEIQNVLGWERFVRRLLDTEPCEVIVTGSSAAMLSREIATELRGRSWEVPLFPFSFREALEHQGPGEIGQPASWTTRRRREVEAAFSDWLRFGGFPEAQALDDPTRAQLLRNYVDVAMLRDVVERHDVSNVAGLRWLVRHLLGNAASTFSVEKFHGALKSQGIRISRDTVHQYLAHLEDCFLVRTVWMESTSERQRMVNPRKSYPVDSGLIPVFDRSGRANLGHALETAVLIELQRRRCEVTYVRTPAGFEVDFLARSPEGHTELIQVCADASAPDTAARELRALADAGPVHPGATKRLLTLALDGLPGESVGGVEVQPAYAWMLG